MIVVRNKAFLYPPKSIDVIAKQFSAVMYQTVFHDAQAWRLNFRTFDTAVRSQQQLKKYGYHIVRSFGT